MGVADYSFKIGADIKEAESALKSLAKTATAAFGLFAAGSFFGKAISDAAEFEAAVNDVAIAFKNSGITGQEATDSIVEFAAAIQETTKFSDDAVLSASALIQNLARLDSEALKGATKSALDLATALKIDVNSAATLVGKAAEGNISAFSRYGIEIRKGKTDAETFANTLKTLQDRFGGSSEAATKTFSGALAQLQNNFGDLLKEIGKTITGSSDIATALNKVNGVVVSLGAAVKDAAPLFSELLSSVVSLATFISNNLVGSIVTLTGVIIALNATALANLTGTILANIGGIITLAKTYGIATVAAATFRTALIATGVGAVIVTIGILAQKVFDAAQEFNGLSNALTVIGLSFREFFARIRGNNQEADKFAARIIGIREAAIQAKKPLQEMADAAKLPDLEKQRRELQVNVEAKFKAELVDKLSKDIEKITSDLKNAGKTQAQIATDTFNQNTETLKAALKNGVIEGDKFKELTKKNEAKYYTEMDKILAEARKKQLEKEKEAAEARKKVFEGISSNFSSALSSLQQGGGGVTGALSNVASTFVNSVIPGLGGAASSLLSFLAQGPEAVAAQVKAFIDNIPVIIENIVLALPALFDALAENFPFLIQRLAELAPSLAVQVAVSFANQMPFVATQLAVNLVAQSPNIAKGFVDSLIKEAGRLITAIADGVKQAISSVVGLGGGKGGLLGGALGGIGGGILGGGIGSIGKKFKFAEGGVVPGGAPYTDRVNALLTPGEVVLSRDQVAAAEAEKINVVSAINNLAASITGGGGQNMTVNLVIGEQQLANVILNLNRQGFRLA